MRIAVGADHAGYELKSAVASLLERDGHELLDVGTDSTESVDYPDFAEAVALFFGFGAAKALVARSIVRLKVRNVRMRDLVNMQNLVKESDRRAC